MSLKKINTLILTVILSVSANAALAEKIQSLILHYDEVEHGVSSHNARYIINDKFMRIDNGHESDDYILFNVKDKTIDSVNHDDKTILHIDANDWKQPEFEFKVTLHNEIMQGAPKVHGKDVYSYQIKADGEMCTNVSLIKDIYLDKMEILYQYQQVLSGQQVATLKNTPIDFQTPCFLVDQIYHTGDYYKMGLPLQITFSRDYMKLLKDYTSAEFDSKLFTLPESYKTYSAAINKE